MVRYLISTHGGMASGIKESLNILLGASEQVDVFDAYIDEANVEEEIKRRIESVAETDYLVMMSDISGGSVNQIMMRYMNRERTFLVTGISLALVVGLVAAYTNEITGEQIEEVISQSREMMVLMEDQDVEEEAFF